MISPENSRTGKRECKAAEYILLQREIIVDLASKVLKGDVQAAARLMRGLEDGVPEAVKELDHIYPHTGKAYIIGIAGAPGVGKSTLTDALISNLRKEQVTIGVIAIDPTSPFTGGAILGDRIRMQQTSVDKDVFIRSMATRGWTGGLAKATMSLIHVFDAMGKDIILVETVGSGQAEVDINRVADSTVIVLSPGMGDEIQLIKAGIMEIADIFVVNKADEDRAEDIAQTIERMINTRASTTGEWKPSVLLTEAISGKGTEKLVEDLFKHREYMSSSGRLKQRRRERAKFELIETIESFVGNYVQQETGEGGYLEKLIDDLAQRKTSPPSAAMEIINQFTQQFNSATV